MNQNNDKFNLASLVKKIILEMLKTVQEEDEDIRFCTKILKTLYLGRGINDVISAFCEGVPDVVYQEQ